MCLILSKNINIKENESKYRQKHKRSISEPVCDLQTDKLGFDTVVSRLRLNLGGSEDGRH